MQLLGGEHKEEGWEVDLMFSHPLKLGLNAGLKESSPLLSAHIAGMNSIVTAQFLRHIKQLCHIKQLN